MVTAADLELRDDSVATRDAIVATALHVVVEAIGRRRSSRSLRW
jgi:hypothetical protein